MLSFSQLFKQQLPKNKNKEHLLYQRTSSLTLFIISDADLHCVMKKSLILASHVHLHFVVYDERIRESRIQSARVRTEQTTDVSAMTHLKASDWPMHS